MDEITALNQRVIADIEGMPWQDTSMPKEQLLQSVKYFIKAYTNDVEEIIKKERQSA